MCGPGEYYNGSVCLDCEQGTYSSAYGLTMSCTSCSPTFPNTTTSGAGARSSDDCSKHKSFYLIFRRRCTQSDSSLYFLTMIFLNLNRRFLKFFLQSGLSYIIDPKPVGAEFGCEVVGTFPCPVMDAVQLNEMK